MSDDRKTKHTPGPWKIFDGWGSSRSTPVVVDCIPDIDGKCVANCICHVAATNDDAAANARLIAAAPEMYEALLDIIENCEVIEKGTVIADFSRKTPMDKARAALAKAKGGAK